MKKCPYCAEEIQDEAIKCKHCGEMLSGAPAESTPSTPSQPTETPATGPSSFSILAFLVALGGFGALIYYWRFFDTTTYKGVHNIGLMQDKQTGMIVGGVFAALGFACLLVSTNKK